MSSMSRVLPGPALSASNHRFLLHPIKSPDPVRSPTYFSRIYSGDFPWSFPSTLSPELARSITGPTSIVLALTRHPYPHSSLFIHLCQDPLYLLPDPWNPSIPNTIFPAIISRFILTIKAWARRHRIYTITVSFVHLFNSTQRISDIYAEPHYKSYSVPISLTEVLIAKT